MYKSVILPSAKKDIREAAKWYEKQQRGIGKRFLAEVRKKNQQLNRNPFAYAIRYGNVRTAIVDIFPYMIHFTIESGNSILISAVLHTSLNPSSWPVTS